MDKTVLSAPVGVFDSGLGGLLILKAIVEKLPEYDFVYLGDTKRVPYGNRSEETVYEFLLEAVEYLFNQGCRLVIVACSTASARALRRIQQEYLPRCYPDRRVLGVIIPTAEVAVAINPTKIGVLATIGTVESQTFVREVHKLKRGIEIIQNPAPLLVPLIESGAENFVEPILKSYLKPLTDEGIDTLILGCTHYPRIKALVRRWVGENVKVVSQDEIIPDKLVDYLNRHPEIDKKLTKRGQRKLLVTDITKVTEKLSDQWFGSYCKLQMVKIDKVVGVKS